MLSSCKSLSSIAFEVDPELKHIEAGAFAGTNLSLIVVSMYVSFIASDAFPAHCTVALDGGDSTAAFREWAARR
jgi:hypothetical protein